MSDPILGGKRGRHNRVVKITLPEVPRGDVGTSGLRRETEPPRGIVTPKEKMMPRGAARVALVKKFLREVGS